MAHTLAAVVLAMLLVVTLGRVSVSLAQCLHEGKLTLKNCFLWSALLSDIPECSTGEHSCSQVCNDTEGSYHCLCFDGYQLTADGFTCAG